MLFDRQRPEVADVRQGPRASQRDKQVDPIGPDPSLVARRLLEPRQIKRWGEGKYEEEHEEDGVIERENPQDPAHVEIAEVMAGALRVVQDPGDQIAREDEEEVDSIEAVVAGLHQEPLERVPWLGIADEMHEQHHDDRETPETVESGDVRVAAQASRASPGHRARRCQAHPGPGPRAKSFWARFNASGLYFLAARGRSCASAERVISNLAREEAGAGAPRRRKLAA